MFFYVGHRRQLVPGIPALTGFELRKENCGLRNEKKRARNLKTLAKRRRKWTHDENLRLLASPFGLDLRALALTCDDLRSL